MPDPSASGLALQNSPLRALHQLGLLEAVIDRGFRHEAVNICAPDGTVVHRIVTEPLVPGTPSFVALPRVTLAEILEEALAATPGAGIRYGTTVTALRDRGDSVEADLSDGTTERFDLVVGADGLHSTVRQQFFPDAPEPRRARQVIWRGSAPRPPEADRYLLHDLGPAGRAGVVPISDDEVYVWMLHRDDGSPRPPAEERLELFRERLAPFGGVVPAVAAVLRPDVDYRSLQALLVPAPWYRGRVVLIGDAAHATTPHIAYGAGHGDRGLRRPRRGAEPERVGGCGAGGVRAAAVRPLPPGRRDVLAAQRVGGRPAGGPVPAAAAGRPGARGALPAALAGRVVRRRCRVRGRSRPSGSSRSRIASAIPLS